jgi:hypothetical protein
MIDSGIQIRDLHVKKNLDPDSGYTLGLERIQNTAIYF